MHQYHPDTRPVPAILLISKRGRVRIMILQRGNVTCVNEKVIWEGWKSLGRRCVGQGGDSQIYEGDKGVWGCQQATKRGRSLQKCKTLKSWREGKNPHPRRRWLKVGLELKKQTIRYYWRSFNKKLNQKEKSTVLKPNKKFRICIGHDVRGW